MRCYCQSPSHARPVCATNTDNSKLSHLSCRVMKYVCESTQGLLAVVLDELHRSLDMEATADVVVETFFEGEFESVNSLELGIYLEINMYVLNGIGKTRDSY